MDLTTYLWKRQILARVKPIVRSSTINIARSVPAHSQLERATLGQLLLTTDLSGGTYVHIYG